MHVVVCIVRGIADKCRCVDLAVRFPGGDPAGGRIIGSVVVNVRSYGAVVIDVGVKRKRGIGETGAGRDIDVLILRPVAAVVEDVVFYFVARTRGVAVESVETHRHKADIFPVVKTGVVHKGVVEQLEVGDGSHGAAGGVV